MFWSKKYINTTSRLLEKNHCGDQINNLELFKIESNHQSEHTF
jgi:hypothetical protein